MLTFLIFLLNTFSLKLKPFSYLYQAKIRLGRDYIEKQCKESTQNFEIPALLSCQKRNPERVMNFKNTYSFFFLYFPALNLVIGKVKSILVILLQF